MISKYAWNSLHPFKKFYVCVSVFRRVCESADHHYIDEEDTKFLAAGGIGNSCELSNTVAEDQTQVLRKGNPSPTHLTAKPHMPLNLQISCYLSVKG